MRVRGGVEMIKRLFMCIALVFTIAVTGMDFAAGDALRGMFSTMIAAFILYVIIDDMIKEEVKNSNDRTK